MKRGFKFLYEQCFSSPAVSAISNFGFYVSGSLVVKHAVQTSDAIIICDVRVTEYVEKFFVNGEETERRGVQNNAIKSFTTYVPNEFGLTKYVNF